jgi:crossover junction endodeoxyribonuclease RuvC
MGVDPGLTRCGLSMIESRSARQVIALDVDVVRTPADDPLAKRLLAISETVEHWMDTHLPDVIAIERVFANQNANTAMGTAQAAGVIALSAARRDIDVYFHTPSEVKAAVTGNGRADKAQVTAMVTKILQLQQKPTPADAADALALAICHCWRAPMIARMAKAQEIAAEQRRAVSPLRIRSCASRLDCPHAPMKVRMEAHRASRAAAQLRDNCPRLAQPAGGVD